MNVSGASIVVMLLDGKSPEPDQTVEVGVSPAECEIEATWLIPPFSQNGFGQYHITIKTPEGGTSRFATFNYEDKNVIRIKLIERSTSEAEVREFTMDSSNQVAGR